MNYIISESKLENVIFKYLDMEFDGIEEIKRKHGYIVLKHPGEEYAIVIIEKMTNRAVNVYVFYGLVEKIMGLFSMETSDALDVIGRYVGNRYNLKGIRTRATPE
jgi:hypothetical protein